MEETTNTNKGVAVTRSGMETEDALFRLIASFVSLLMEADGASL